MARQKNLDPLEGWIADLSLQNSTAPAQDKPKDDDLVTVTLMIRRDTYEAAKAIATDPNATILGELAGTMDTEEFLGQYLDAEFENDTSRK